MATDPKPRRFECPECHGICEWDRPTGRTLWGYHGPEQEWLAEVCRRCQGTGEISEFVCPECGGEYAQWTEEQAARGQCGLCRADELAAQAELDAGWEEWRDRMDKHADDAYDPSDDLYDARRDLEAEPDEEETP